MGIIRFDKQGNPVIGRMVVKECPEGIARKAREVVGEARMVAEYGPPDGVPWNRTDNRLMQIVETVRAFDREE